MTPTPPHVLLVDDDAAVLNLVKEALTHYGMVVHAFSEGHRALELLQSPEPPPFDLVISDINMDGMDGFDVINKVKTIQSNLPVVLMTGQATLEYAIRAMRLGASNLFQKPLAIREMVKAVFHLVEIHREMRLAVNGLKGLVKEERIFSFRSDELDIPSVVRHLTDRLVPLGFAEPHNVDVIAMAFHEALVNALEHGNLELDSTLKADLFSDQDPYQALRQERLADEKFAARKVTVRVDVVPDRFAVEITDEGPGFDTTRASAPVTDADVLARQCGRGLAMIQVVMHQVLFNARGNEIRMVLEKPVKK
ncbi:MAG: response regulator [Holophagaceae bacterium]|nr:response regulator [Holophagaceae bacterium]